MTSAQRTCSPVAPRSWVGAAKRWALTEGGCSWPWRPAAGAPLAPPGGLPRGLAGELLGARRAPRCPSDVALQGRRLGVAGRTRRGHPPRSFGRPRSWEGDGWGPRTAVAGDNSAPDSKVSALGRELGGVKDFPEVSGSTRSSSVRGLHKTVASGNGWRGAVCQPYSPSPRGADGLPLRNSRDIGHRSFDLRKGRWMTFSPTLGSAVVLVVAGQAWRRAIGPFRELPDRRRTRRIRFLPDRP